MRPEFQQAVNQAVGIESRHGPRHQKRVEAVKEAVENISPQIFLI